MPAISKIRYTNVIYENGGKRYIDTVFQFDGYNGILLLENGGGKTVFVQTLLQAVLPHAKIAGRRISDTLQLNNNVAHIAVEWILSEEPRRYAVTAVSLFMNSREQIASCKFVNEYAPGDKDRIEKIPFVRTSGGQSRAAGKEEIAEYYRSVSAGSMVAKFFGENDTLTAYQEYIEQNFKIIPAEWSKIAVINMSEGGVEEYFSKCDTAGALIDRLLIPTVEEALGGGKNDFIDLFEKQRVHFQKQRQLKSRIEELSQVSEDLNVYNQKLKIYDDMLQSLKQQKAELKGLYRCIERRMGEKQAALADKDSAREQCRRQLEENERALAAVQVGYAAEKMQAAKQARDAAEREKIAAQDALAASERQESQLRAAELRQLHREENALSEDLAHQLAQLDGDAAIADTKELLDENAAMLSGCFADAEHQMRRELSGIIRQAKTAGETIAALDKRRGETQEKLRVRRARKDEGSGKISQLVEFMTVLETELLDDPLHETVSQEAPKWEKAADALEEEAERLGKESEELRQELAHYRQEIPAATKQMNEWKIQRSDTNGKLERITDGARELMNGMRELPVFAALSEDIGLFYQKEERWLRQLEESSELLLRQSEAALAEERRVYRDFDDYARRDIFTADARLPALLEKWRDSFSLLESGTAHFQAICRMTGADPEAVRRFYPQWAASVVVTAKEADKAARFIEDHAAALGQAVVILTEQEVREICAGKEWKIARQVVPAKWDNILPDKFARWQAALEEEAAKATAEKRRVESQYQLHQRLLAKLRNFFRVSGFREYQELQAEREEIANRLERAERSLTRLIDAEHKVSEMLAHQEERRRAAARRQEKLRANIARARQYFDYAAQQRSLLAGSESLQREIAAIDRKLQAAEREQNSQQRLLEDLRGAEAQQTERLHMLKQRKFYEDTHSAAPRDSSLGYDALAERRENLLAELDGRQRDRRLVDEKLRHARKLCADFARRLQDIRDKADFSLAEDFVFPTGGKEELAALARRIKAMRPVVQSLCGRYETANDAYQNACGAHAGKLDGYRRRYEELIVFTRDLAEEEAQLKEARTHNAAAAVKLEEDVRRCKEEIALTGRAETLLLRKNETLHFTYDEIETAVLDVALTEKTSAELAAAVQERLSRAEEARGAAEEKERENNRHKDRFIGECRRKIADERMKQLVLTGIAAKTSYADFIGWHEKIRENIAYSIRIAEGEQKEHFTHIEQIVTQVHTYLADVAEELRLLPKKTRIKTDGASRDFYIIHVPEWKESDGKEVIRHYFDYIAKRLDQPEFRDEFGKEKIKEIRVSLEKFLRTQQLLNQLIGANSIRVKCRKVTNDRQLSIGTYTWEESCHWSGGEKWSKNMALFLGCLNYLAEKGKNIYTGKSCNRVVIADNPFGQASSEHVLNPVFFIAKQLGFQFIALTAHDEGGFIRKYFPVVYSLRFAQAQGINSQVIQLDKEIKTAFFKEENPATLERLADYEEMGLFD